MPGASTSFVGPLGSTIYHLRADAETVAALAGLDWTSRFRRVCLDPVRGVVVLMVPSLLHERSTRLFDDIADSAASALGLASIKLGSVRVRGEGEPVGVGLEPDCSFLVGERAHAHLEALAESEEAADAFLEANVPDLVVEVEITHADEGKIARYGDMGVRECWRIHGRSGEGTLRADFLALRRGAAPRRLEASEVLPDLTPSDVAEAAEGIKTSGDVFRRIETVERIIRRRRQRSVRPREEPASGGEASADGEPPAAAVSAEGVPVEGSSAGDP